MSKSKPLLILLLAMAFVTGSVANAQATARVLVKPLNGEPRYPSAGAEQKAFPDFGDTASGMDSESEYQLMLLVGGTLCLLLAVGGGFVVLSVVSPRR